MIDGLKDSDPVLLAIIFIGVLCVVFPEVGVNFFRLGAFLNFSFKEAKKPSTQTSLWLIRLLGMIILLVLLLRKFHLL